MEFWKSGNNRKFPPAISPKLTASANDIVIGIYENASMDLSSNVIRVLKNSDNIGAIGAAMLVLQKEYDIDTTAI